MKARTRPYAIEKTKALDMSDPHGIIGVTKKETR
jgi:hypothetical protein